MIHLPKKVNQTKARLGIPGRFRSNAKCFIYALYGDSLPWAFQHAGYSPSAVVQTVCTCLMVSLVWPALQVGGLLFAAVNRRSDAGSVRACHVRTMIPARASAEVGRVGVAESLKIDGIKRLDPAQGQGADKILITEVMFSNVAS